MSSVLLRERHTAFVSPTNEPDGTMRQQLTLLIERLSYSDAGTYVCEFDDNDQTLRASAELALEGNAIETVFTMKVLYESTVKVVL